MLRIAAVFVLLCLSTIAHAGEVVGLPLWSEDGRWFVYTSDEKSHVYLNEDDLTGFGEVFTIAHVVDVRTGVVQDYLIEHKTLQEGRSALGKELKGVLSKAAFEKWISGQRLVPGTFSRESNGLRVETAWKGGAWKADAFNFEVEDAGTLEVAALRGKSRLAPASVKLSPQAIATQCRLRVNWAPGASAVAYVVEWPEKSWMLGPVEGQAEVLVRALGLRVQVTAHRSVSQKAVQKTTAALIAAGMPATVGPPALKARQATVIYAAPALLEEVARLAQVVPGGATVEPLTWAVDADVVVALGDSATR